MSFSASTLRRHLKRGVPHFPCNGSIMLMWSENTLRGGVFRKESLCVVRGLGFRGLQG